MTAVLGNHTPQSGAAAEPETPGGRIGRQLWEYVHRGREEGKTEESREAYAARVYAKAQSGKKLTPEEMDFLARTNPELYRRVLRAQMMRNALESKLKSCDSRQEAQEVFSEALSSVSKDDPDRDMIVAALMDAYREFKESMDYKSLPEKDEEEKKGGQDVIGGTKFCVNGCGYQEAYAEEDGSALWEA